MQTCRRVRAGLLVLAIDTLAVAAYDGFLAFDVRVASVETVHDVEAGRWVLHGLVVMPGIAALAGARWPRASARSLIALAAMVPVAWFVSIAAHAEVTGEDACNAGMLVVVLVPTVSARLLWAGMAMKDAVAPRHPTAGEGAGMSPAEGAGKCRSRLVDGLTSRCDEVLHDWRLNVPHVAGTATLCGCERVVRH